MSEFEARFSDPEAVSKYAEGPPRFVPGFADLHTMTTLLLAERVPKRAKTLVLGAGGGLELRHFAETRPDWTFVGVDPSAEMLDLARKTLGAHAERVELVQGLIDDAPDGPFDGGTCLLTLHFLERDERIRTAGEVRRRLKPGAPFVAAHSSFPQDARDLWLDRYAAFALASGADPEEVKGAHKAVSEHLALYEPGEDADILRAAGFQDVDQFYRAFTWSGWVGYA